MEMYEAAPGVWLPVGVTMEQHNKAVEENYVGPLEDLVEFYSKDFIHPSVWKEDLDG